MGIFNGGGDIDYWRDISVVVAEARQGKWVKQVCPKAQIGLTMWGMRFEEDDYEPKENELCWRVFVTQQEIDRMRKEAEGIDKKLSRRIGVGAFTFPPEIYSDKIPWTPGMSNQDFQIKLDTNYFRKGDNLGPPKIRYKSRWDKFLYKVTFGWFGRLVGIEYDVKEPPIRTGYRRQEFSGEWMAPEWNPKTK